MHKHIWFGSLASPRLASPALPCPSRAWIPKVWRNLRPFHPFNSRGKKSSLPEQKARTRLLFAPHAHTFAEHHEKDRESIQFCTFIPL